MMVEMEFSIDGEATMYFHAPPSPATPNAQQSEAYLLSSKGNGLEANRKYKMMASYIGSQLVVTFDGGEIQRYEPQPSFAKRRWGGIVFMIPEGTRMKITRMRFKELR